MSNGRKDSFPAILVTVAVCGITVSVTLIIFSLSTLPKSLEAWLASNIDNPRQLYMLSATAQVLAALFALTFSITLITIQLITKYTHRAMKVIFNDTIVILYMGGFALAVVLPLWFISHPTGWGSWACVFNGSIYTLSLVPFFLNLRNRMQMESIINSLKRDAIRVLYNSRLKDEARKEKAEENVNALDNIAMGAYTDRNFEVFEMAEGALVDLLFEAQRHYKESQDVSLFLFYRDIFETARDTCEELIDNPRAPRIIIKKFGEACASAIKERPKSFPEDDAINIINIVSEECTKEVQYRLLFACVVALAEMAEAVKGYKDIDIEKEIARKIGGICPRFKNKERWHPKVIKHMRSRRMWSLLALLLRPIFRPKD